MEIIMSVRFSWEGTVKKYKVRGEWNVRELGEPLHCVNLATASVDFSAGAGIDVAVISRSPALRVVPAGIVGGIVGL